MLWLSWGEIANCSSDWSLLPHCGFFTNTGEARVGGLAVAVAGEEAPCPAVCEPPSSPDPS